MSVDNKLNFFKSYVTFIDYWFQCQPQYERIFCVICDYIRKEESFEVRKSYFDVLSEAISEKHPSNNFDYFTFLQIKKLSEHCDINSEEIEENGLSEYSYMIFSLLRFLDMDSEKRRLKYHYYTDEKTNELYSEKSFENKKYFYPYLCTRIACIYRTMEKYLHIFLEDEEYIEDFTFLHNFIKHLREDSSLSELISRVEKYQKRFPDLYLFFTETVKVYTER